MDIERTNVVLLKAIDRLQAEEVEGLHEFSFSYGYLMVDASGGSFNVVDTSSKRFRAVDSDPVPVVKRFRFQPQDKAARQRAFNDAMRWAKKKGKGVSLSRIVNGMKQDGLIK